ncbi:hypothetical protein L1049_015249 [Liquidambar formosana]|uniref:Uncharacterized protein n=1 Tax=Liquidambar formosana TaxID=63359 RepID=A0AAP0RYJ5_LIQFO
MSGLSESAPMVIEDIDSVFGDLDQIISGASSQAGSTSGNLSQSEADDAAAAPPSQEAINKAKAIFENCLPLDFKLLLHPCRRGLFLEAISTLISFSDLPSDKISALQRFRSDFPSLASSFQFSEKELEENQKLIDTKISLAEILKLHVTVYKTLKTKEELINEEIKKLQEELKLKEEEKKNIISKKLDLAKETKVKKVTLSKYNTESPSWMQKIKKAKDTSSHVISSWHNFKENFV